MSNPKKDLIPKNFFKKLKYFLVEPVKSSAEAEARKKELIPYTLVAFGAVVLFLILGMIIKPIAMVFNVIAYIGMFFVFVFGWCLYKAISLKKKFADLECSNCKTVIKYSPDLTIDILNRSFGFQEHRTSNPNGGVDIEISGIETCTVNINCKCQNCGTEKTLKKIFTPISCSISNKGVSVLNADLVILDMKKKLQNAYDNGFENYSSEIKIKTKSTPEKEVKAYFNEDGTAGKTPWGTVRKI